MSDELIQRLVMTNLRRAQAFDASLKGGTGIDAIVSKVSEAILFETNDRKRTQKIDKLVTEIVKQAETKTLPDAQTIGETNAETIIDKSPAPKVSLSDRERGAAAFAQKAAGRKRAKIVRTDVESNGKRLDSSLSKFWDEPAEGSRNQKRTRIAGIHVDMERQRKEWEAEAAKFNAGERRSRPGKPKLDYLSLMTADSKTDIRAQARRTGTDAEIALFRREGYANFIWIAPNGLSACPDCVNRQNCVLTMPEWEVVGRPGSGYTICLFNCFCMLLPEETAAYAPSLITKRHTTERGPMTDARTLAFLNANRIEKTK